jgi:hypothetical protein
MLHICAALLLHPVAFIPIKSTAILIHNGWGNSYSIRLIDYRGNSVAQRIHAAAGHRGDIEPEMDMEFNHAG